MSNFRIKSNPAYIQGIKSIHFQHIDIGISSRQNLPQSFLHTGRIPQMPGKTISTSDRNNAESNLTPI